MKIDLTPSEDCKHCDHLRSQYSNSAGNHKEYVCCHCGRVRTETLRPVFPDSGGTWHNKPEDHGPHKPSTTPMW